MNLVNGEAVPAGAKILEASGEGGTGNVLYLFREIDPPLVLKVYRWRGSRFREFLKDLSQRLFEGKRGACARARCETEQQSLALWAREGFAVPAPVNRLLPEAVAPPALWIKYRPAPKLNTVLTDDRVPLANKESLLRKLGDTVGRRHRRALESSDPLLIHEHGMIQHFLVDGDDLVAFDLEQGYHARFPVRDAMALELAGISRSIIRLDEEHADLFLKALIGGYADRDLLRDAAERAVRGGGIRRRIRRWRDRRRGPVRSKTRALERLLSLIDA